MRIRSNRWTFRTRTRFHEVGAFSILAVLGGAGCAEESTIERIGQVVQADQTPADNHVVRGRFEPGSADGELTFTFDVSLDDEDRALVHDILDFEAGDRLVIKQYQIRSEWDDDDDRERDREDDRFERNYGDKDDDDQPFRFRIEKIGDREWTFVDVFVEQQDERDFSIEILGSHRLYYY